MSPSSRQAVTEKAPRITNKRKAARDPAMAICALTQSVPREVKGTKSKGKGQKSKAGSRKRPLTFDLAPLHVPCRRRCHRARRGRHREHDSKPDRDDDADRQPDTRNLVENARLPQRKACSDQQDEITDEVEFQVLHIPAISTKDA